jgi:N-acetylmuramoyl-L-alanine amidase
MRWIERFRKPWAIALLVLVFSVLLVRESRLLSAEEKRLAVFAPHSTYALAVIDRDNSEYVSVYDLLEPLGKVQLKAEGGSYRIRMNEIDGMFADGASKIRIGRSDISFQSKVVVDQGKVLLPLRVVPAVLKQYLNLNSDLRESGRRLFIGNTSARISTEFSKKDGSLVLMFPAAVNPNVSTEAGKVHLLFTRDPVVFGADNIAFTDRLVNNISFVERNGTAELVVSGTSPLLATFGDGGKTITISAAPAPVVTQSAPITATASPTPSTAPPAAANAPVSTGTPAPSSTPEFVKPNGAPTNALRFFVMIDAGHGGTETGARFSDKLEEKEITLLLARRLRTELQSRGVTAVLLRDTDSNVTLDQRASTSNSQRSGLYVSIHAGGPGTGVRVYTALMPSPDPNGKKTGPFIPWQTAQASYLERSRLVAGNVVSEMADKKVKAVMITAPVPPLNSIAAPALAIEVAPPSLSGTPDSLFTTSYQQTIAVAMATAIVNVRPKIEEQR